MFNLFGKKDTVKETEVDTEKADGAEVLFEELRYIGSMFRKTSDKVHRIPNNPCGVRIYKINTRLGERYLCVNSDYYVNQIILSEGIKGSGDSIDIENIVYILRVDRRSHEKDSRSVYFFEVSITPRLMKGSQISEEDIYLSVKELLDMAEEIAELENEHKANIDKLVDRFSI